MRSGSRVTQEQFLLFRAICKKIRDPNRFNAASLNLGAYLQQARQMLRNSPEFQNYLAAIGTKPLQSIGMFHIPLLQQREVLILPQKNATPLNKIDETSVNSSFISFLQAITAIDPAPDHEWRSLRIRLHANFGIVRGKAKEYVSVTDGQFQHINSDNIMAIAECKQGSRRTAVDMQEVAEIVAWIKEYPNRNVQ